MIAYQKGAFFEDGWREIVDSGVESMNEEIGPSRFWIVRPGNSRAYVNSDTSVTLAE